jgi:dolichol-phosphate mannosyltransferase
MLLSLVIPIYNEAEVLPALFARLRSVLRSLDCASEVVFVDDGSNDGTSALLRSAAAEEGTIKVLTLSRNFGHQAAITAGLDFASGDAVVVMDADLQDPPELLPEMLRLLQSGFDVVSPQRAARNGEGVFKRWTAAGFYWLMRHGIDERLTAEVGDFRMFSRAALTALRAFREQHRFMRGLVAWLGLNEAILPFERSPRAGGKTKYSSWKMLRLAWQAISSFSAAPLRASAAFGMLLSILGFAYFIYSVLAGFMFGVPLIRGWMSLVALQCLLSGMILFALGLIGDYLARIYEESKGRPLYIVSETLNVAPAVAAPRAVVLQPRNERARV